MMENIKLVARLIFKDPETGEELFLSNIDDNANGETVLSMRNGDGTRKWSHTIKTQEE